MLTNPLLVACVSETGWWRSSFGGSRFSGVTLVCVAKHLYFVAAQATQINLNTNNHTKTAQSLTIAIIIDTSMAISPTGTKATTAIIIKLE